MAQNPPAKRSIVIPAVVGVLVVAALAVGAVWWHANRGRADQLHDDEVRRQRDAVLNAAVAKEKGPTTAPATLPAGR